MSKTPDQLVSEIRQLVEELTKLTGARTPDTKEPLIFGNGLVDVREVNGQIQISLGTDFGWVQTKTNLVFGMGVAGQIQMAVVKSLTAALPKADLPIDQTGLH